MPLRYRYSQWDGTQEVAPLSADDVLEGMTEDLMNFGDVQHALRSMMQRGMRMPNGGRMQGLRDLLQQLRQQRREALDRFDLSSVFDEIQQKLDEILDLERGTLDERLDSMERPPGASPGAPDAPRDSGDGEAGDGEAGDGEAGDASGDPAGDQAARGETPGGQTARGQASSGRASSGPAQPGQPKAGEPHAGAPEGGSPEGGLSDEEKARLLDTLRDRLQRKAETIDTLPPDASGQMRGLREYEFENPEAAQKYQELLDSLKQQMMNQFFQDMAQSIQNMSPEDVARMREMIQDLNEMLRQRANGEEPDFDGFMDQYGDLFGDNPPQSLEDLVEQIQRQSAAMQNMVDSLPGEMRQQLQDLMQDLMQDAGLSDDLHELADNLESLYPMREMRNQYPFRGDEDLDMQAAMELMRHMQDLDEMERQLERTQYGGDLNDVDTDKLEELLGEEAREALEQLKQLLEILEDAGYIRRKGKGWELTPRGTRMIGQRALAEIYQNLKGQQFGKHELPEFGRYGERADETKAYEFGDPFHLNLRETLQNAIYRAGPGVPVSLHPDDFEIYRSETLTQTATVLMLDLSWSMALRGSFQAAKKVALALQNLIKMQYPRDSLYLVGFSAYARELKTDELPYVRWDETVLGTNMHHALLIAQQLLAKHKQGTRQVIMITDGEPTAHLENGRSYFAYPPSPVTIRETLKEVKHCTKKGIVINTFMLDRNYYLKEFMGQVAKINKGRVFYTTPDQLGEYILVDFVSNKRRTLGR